MATRAVLVKSEQRSNSRRITVCMYIGQTGLSPSHPLWHVARQNGVNMHHMYICWVSMRKQLIFHACPALSGQLRHPVMSVASCTRSRTVTSARICHVSTLWQCFGDQTRVTPPKRDTALSFSGMTRIGSSGSKMNSFCLGQ